MGALQRGWGGRTCVVALAIAAACSRDYGHDEIGVGTGETSSSGSGAPGSSSGAMGSDSGAAETVSTGAATSDATSTSGVGTDGGGSDSGGSGVTTGDDPGTHGNGMCGGGFGDPNDLAHLPPCPNGTTSMHDRYQASRSNYYHDGDHVFEPNFVPWDDGLAAIAQQYAEEYAGGAPPNGEQFYTPAYPYDPYWQGTYQGYVAVAGAETPTSCDCGEPDPFLGPTPAAAFYNLSSAYFRANVIRMDGVQRMGIGHVAPGDGSHFWTFVFAMD